MSVDAALSAGEVISSESDTKVVKVALDSALKLAKKKPVLNVATNIVLLATVPITGVAAGPRLFVACGILIAKTLG